MHSMDNVTGIRMVIKCTNHPLSSSPVSPTVLLGLEPTLLKKVKQLMLYNSDKFHYQNQQKIRYITLYTKMQKFPHLQYVTFKLFRPDSSAMLTNDKAFHTQKIKILGFCLDIPNIQQKYIDHSVQTTQLYMGRHLYQN